MEYNRFMEKSTLLSHTTSAWLPFLLAIAIFMQMLDATILNTALPEIAADLNESPLNMQLAVISYTLTVALLIPLSGYLADKFGTKKVFFGSIALFMLGSALCAASASLLGLAFSRIIQGIGGSMLVPIPRLTILRVYEKSKLLNAINYAVMPALIGPVLGPLAGGYLVEYASWHWIFLLNLPIGLLGFILGRNIMPDIKGSNISLDFKGYLIFSAAACLLLLSAESLSHALPPYISLCLLGMGLLFAPDAVDVSNRFRFQRKPVRLAGCTRRSVFAISQAVNLHLDEAFRLPQGAALEYQTACRLHHAAGTA